MRANKRKAAPRKGNIRRPARKVAPRAESSPGQAIVRANQELSLPEKVEQVLIGGDLTPLTPQERVEYYRKVCQSLGLNWLTQPFTYILFREGDNSPAKLQLYANKDCAAQLRKLHRISICPPLRRVIADGMCMVEADLRDGNGKTDSATGVVPLWKWKNGQREELTGREWANAVMKCETKAKRRGTLSICGLAFLDESELDTMQVIGGVTRDGRIYEFKQPAEEVRELPDADNPHLQKFLEREKAELEKLKQAPVVKHETPPEGQETAETSPSAVPCLFVVQLEPNRYEILGRENLIPDLKNILRPHYNSDTKQVIVNDEQLDALKFEYEKHSIQIRPLEKMNG